MNRPLLNVHRSSAAGFKPENGGNPFCQGLGKHLCFSAQHLPSIIEKTETERSQAKYKVICRSPSNSVLQGWNVLSLSPNSRPDGLLNLGFHGLTLITMLVSNELGDSKSLVDSFQAVELFFCSHYQRGGFVISLAFASCIIIVSLFRKRNELKTTKPS